MLINYRRLSGRIQTKLTINLAEKRKERVLKEFIVDEFAEEKQTR